MTNFKDMRRKASERRRKALVDFMKQRYGSDLVDYLGDGVINRCLEIISQYRKAPLA